MTHDPTAGGQNPWDKKENDPNQTGPAHSENQYGQEQYGQGSYGEQGGNQYGQNVYGQQPPSADYGSYGSPQAPSSDYGERTDASGGYPQGQAVYGSPTAGYGQDAPGQQPHGYNEGGSTQPGGYGQMGYDTGSYGQSGQPGQGGYAPGYGQGGGYGAGSPGYADATGASGKRKRGKGMLIGLIAAGVVVLLVVGGLIWEFAGRGSAGNTYASLIEEQGIEINGEVAEGDLQGSFQGGSYVFESLGGEFSRVEVTGSELVANGVPYDITYTLVGAPASGEGTIDHVFVNVNVPADSIADAFFDGEMEGMQVELTSDGIVLTMDEFGSELEMVMQIRAEEGWLVTEITSATLDGEDYSSEVETVEYDDPCADTTDFESVVLDAGTDEEGIHVQWRIDDVATADLATAACMA